MKKHRLFGNKIILLKIMPRKWVNISLSVIILKRVSIDRQLSTKSFKKELEISHSLNFLNRLFNNNREGGMNIEQRWSNIEISRYKGYKQGRKSTK